MSYYCEKCKEQRTQGCFGRQCPGMPKYASVEGLPPLPAPDRTVWQYGRQIDHYTSDQMRDYADAATAVLMNDADVEIGRMVTAGLGQKPPESPSTNQRAREELAAIERHLTKRCLADELSLTNLWLLVDANGRTA